MMTKKQYILVNEQVAPYLVGTRAKSASMLAWFLEDVWRLDDADAETAICDGGGDKGIDALVVDEDLQEITILQGKYRETDVKTQGDTDLKALVGAAIYFQTPETIDQLIASKPNEELLRLLRRIGVRERLQQGQYAIRLVFVTNAMPDSSATDYLKAAEIAGHPIELWDRKRLSEVAARTQRPDLRPEEVVLTAAARPSAVSLTKNERMVVALVSAQQLVKLPGIVDLSLFARNVRLSAGKTRINRELARTITRQEEHALFAAYHNGMTLLTHGVKEVGKKITLDGVGVVNGCQSLLALANSASGLTEDLLVLVKIVEVSEDNDVADKITFRSNNQNAVNLRDQRSTEPVMRDLQGEVREKFSSEFDFLIRVGETPTAKSTLDNTTAAQLITATYLNDPSAAVRKVKLFDEDFRKIFSRNIDAYKLYFLYLLDANIRDARASLRPDLRGAFASIRFTLAYLVVRVIELSDDGTTFLSDPSIALPARKGEVTQKIGEILADVIDSVNFHVAEEQDDDPMYDPKVAFKSRSGVLKLERDVLRSSRRLAKKEPDYLFSLT